MLCIHVERCFESLICWLDLWLSSHIVAFSSYVFFSHEKLLFYVLNSFSTDTSFIEISGLTLIVSWQIGRSIELKSIALCLLDISLTDSQSIEVGFCSIAAWKLLDLSRPSCMHCFSHVFIASCALCQSWQKERENVVSFQEIWHVRGRNTCLCKGELCLILLGGVFTSLF